MFGYSVSSYPQIHLDHVFVKMQDSLRRSTKDREIERLKKELEKFEMTDLSEYATELGDKQAENDDAEIEARCSAVSNAQGDIKSMLEESLSIYDSANCGIRVLSETIQHDEDAAKMCSDLIECAKINKENIIRATKEFVAAQREIARGLCERSLLNEERSSGLEKLMALIQKLKITEEDLHASVKVRLEETELEIQNKTMTGDTLRDSNVQLEARCEEAREKLRRDKETLDIQSERVREEEEEVMKLRAKKVELEEHLRIKRNDLEALHASYDSLLKQLELLTKEENALQHSSIELQEAISAMEKQNAECSEWKRRMSADQEHLSTLEKQVRQEEENFQRVRSAAAALRDRFSAVGKENWTETRWQESLQEQETELVLLRAELNTCLSDIEAHSKEVTEVRKEEEIAENMLALERELIAYADQHNLKKKQVAERQRKAVAKLDCGREYLTHLQAVYSAMRSEHGSLLSELRSVQAQIDAFTCLRTPTKPIPAPGRGSDSRSQTAKRRLSSKQNVVDSDSDVSQAQIPEVEGLEPFSPATVSLKERRKKGRAQVTEFTRESKSTTSSGTCSDERIISGRFPNDIFLNKSPSLGPVDSAISANVSTDDTLDDGEQSVWSCNSPDERPASIMDLTGDSDLDQSVW
ncbi:hypothetical protein Q1695_002285 [Nippostrongylus brasiliensis]|nr:hypothetical protein Q1695_002285 [Nippostrongylus brasiliensis]